MSILVYLLQVTACTAVFYLFYYLLLNRLTFFVTNRWYLLVTVLISFAIPLLTIKVDQPHAYVGVVEQVVDVYAPKTIITNNSPVAPTVSESAPINWMAILKQVYLWAVAALTLHLLITLIAFFKRLQGKRITKIGNVNILSGNKKINNGSFLNYIFLNEQELSADEMQQIIAHEMLHVKLYHSVDRIIVKIAQIILWFNPFIYLYARSVEENHEFEVDREVARSTDKHNYANLLLHLSVAGNGMLYHNFSKVPLKKRITMLFNQPSTNMKKIIYVLVAPVLLISCLAFARMKKQDDTQPRQYSVITGVDKLGKDPLVLIDGKVYKKEILYRISKSCIKSSGSWNPDASMIKHGVSIKDGYIDIKTKNGKITYLTAIEKENLAAEAAIPASQLYSRIHLKKEDGSTYDKVIVKLTSGAMASSQIEPNDKVAFVIDNKVYNEEEFKKLSPEVTNSFSGAFGVGATNSDYFAGLRKEGFNVNLKGYETAFHFKTIKSDNMNQYRQKGSRYDLKDTSRLTWEAYSKSPEALQKMKLSNDLMGRTITAKVKSIIPPDKDGTINDLFIGKGGVLLTYNGNDYLMQTGHGQEKQMSGRLNVDDEITLKVFSTGFSKSRPVMITPAYVVKNNEKIFQLAEAGKMPDYGFLYEANKVRFAEGQVSQIQKYASGKWKSALFETVNGYKFNLSFKPNAPSDLNTIADGDHVRLRFVHEVKTGAKTYAINDWVSITTNIRDYGVKNPDWFFKFYQLTAKTKILNVTDSVFHISSKIINHPDSVKPGQSFYLTADQKLTWTKRTYPINVVSSASGKLGKKDLDLYKVHISDPDFDLTADHIRIDTGKHQLIATGNAVFKRNSGKETFKTDSLVYNYQNKSARLKHVDYRYVPQ